MRDKRLGKTMIEWILEHYGGFFSGVVVVAILGLMVKWLWDKFRGLKSAKSDGYNRIVILLMLFTILVTHASTQNQIRVLYEMDKKTKSTLLFALLSECEGNLRIINEVISRKERYTQEYVDGAEYHFSVSEFSSEAYRANLNNGTVDESNLLTTETTIHVRKIIPIITKPTFNQ